MPLAINSIAATGMQHRGLVSSIQVLLEVQVEVRTLMPLAISSIAATGIFFLLHGVLVKQQRGLARDLATQVCSIEAS